MKSFRYALLLSLRYRWSIAGAVACSAGVALLWCASLTTIYPVLQVVLANKTAVTWAEQEIVRCEERIEDHRATLQRLVPPDSGTTAESLPPDQAYEAGFANKQILIEENARSWYRGLLPWLQQYAPATPFATLVWAILFLVVITSIKGVLLVVSSILVARVANQTVMDMRRIYFRKALDMDQRRIDNIGTANMMTHLSHNMMMVSGALQVFYGKMLREPLKMLVCLAGAAWISWPLLLLSLFVVPAGALVIRSLSRRMKRSTQREMEGMSSVFQTLIETFGSLKTVRIFGREIRERRRFKRNSAALYRMSVRLSLYDSLIRPISEVLGILSISGSILAGAWLVLNQKTELFQIPVSDRPLDPMALLLFYMMLAGVSDPARKMSEVINVLVRGGTACENLARTFDVAPLIARPEQPVAVPLHQQEIRFERVSFAYRSRQPVVHQLDLVVPFGQTVAIVGENGCGKSTLMNLLVRFYDPYAGRILIDGQDLRTFSPRQLRRQFAWVTQDSDLFTGSLRENIAFGKPRATEKEILNAACLARVTDFLPQLENGLDTRMDDAARNLSAGQRQRVALARAIICDPRILILDEATSQIDGRNEQLLHDSLRAFLKQRTTFLISHRRSSLELADRVIVMKAGKVVLDSAVGPGMSGNGEFSGLFHGSDWQAPGAAA